MKARLKLPMNAIPGPEDITRAELPNGIVVLVRPDFNSPSVSLSGYLPAGSLFDSDEKLGLADFTASVLMRGTARYDFNQIYHALESVGASLGFSGGTHTTGFFGRSLTEDLPLLLDLLSDTLRRPAFPARQVEKMRVSLLTGLDLRQQDTQDQADLAFDQLVYPNHPYSRPDEGYPQTVKAIRRADLRKFHRKCYGPRGLAMAIAGGIEPEHAVALVAKALGDWRNPEQPLPPVLPEWKPLQKQARVRVALTAKSQSDLVVGTAGPPRSAPDFMAAVVGNSILGEFGMMGRIGEALRERSGLAYYASSSLGSSMGPGAWAVYAGVHPKDEERAVELIFEQIRRFVTELVSVEELEDVQANMVGRMPLSLESNTGMAAQLLHIERHRLGLDYLLRYPALVQAITREEVLAAASHYLHPERLAVAIAGPLEKEPD